LHFTTGVGCVGHLALQRDVAEHVQEESAASSRAALLDHLLEE
jgi:hypothetical protein